MISGTGASDLPPALQSLLGIALGFLAIHGARRAYADPEWGRQNRHIQWPKDLSLNASRKLAIIGVFIGFLILFAGVLAGLEEFVPALIRYRESSGIVMCTIAALATGLLLSKTRHRKLDSYKP